MPILEILLGILILLIIYLIFIIKKNSGAYDKDNFTNQLLQEIFKENLNNKNGIIQEILKENGNIKTELTKSLGENKENISKDINEFKNNLKSSIQQDVISLIDKVDKKLKENNDISLKISNDNFKSINSFKEELQKNINENINNFITKLNTNFESNSKNITDFKLNIQESISKKVDELTKKVEEKLNSSNALDKNIKEGISTLKEDVKKNIQKDLLDLGAKVELRLKEGFENTDKTFKNLIERLTVIDKAQEKIFELSNNIMSLQKILSDKKSRGSFGEQRLEQVLNYVYGDSNLYSMQYKLSNGKIVDSIIRINDKEQILCIDSKFPLENYSKYIENKSSETSKYFIQDVRKHIDDISNKYIVEGETANTAMMFLPSEAIFMEIYSNFEKEILEYAYNKKIWIVSQTNLMIYISTMQHASINYRKNKNAEVILKRLSELSVEFNRYKDRWESLEKDFSKLDDDFRKIRTTADKLSKKFSSINQMVEIEEEVIKN